MKMNARYSMESLALDPATADALRILAERRGTPESAVLLSAFAATHHRHSRQDPVTIGLVLDERPPHSDSATACCIPLRIAFPSGATFEDLLVSTAVSFEEAIEQRKMHSDADDGQLPHFPLRFAVTGLDTRDPGVALPGLSVDPPKKAGEAELSRAACTVRSGGVAVLLELDCDGHSLPGIGSHRWWRSFHVLLQDAVKRPHARIDELRMLSSDEEDERAAVINSTFDVYPHLKPIHQPFESAARDHPDRVAIHFGDVAVTYGELDRRANHMAQSLAGAGIGLERVVGICMERSPELIVSVLATLKAGAAFVPLDPSLPVGRIQSIVTGGELAAIMTDEKFNPLLQDTGVMLFQVDDTGSVAPPPVEVALNDTAYIYFTSGSTGEPKGVVIDHRCAAGRIESLLQRFPLKEGESVLLKTPLIFDVAIWEIFGPLSVGATIQMALPRGEADADYLAGLLSTRGLVATHFVPSMLSAFLDYARPQSYPDLRCVWVSGEAVSSSLLDRFTQHFSAEFHNLYGQTETSEVAAWTGSKHDSVYGVPIGKQMGVYRLFVLDDALNLVPPGVVGQLGVAGVGGLSTGYQNNSELTAERFVAHPYPLSPDELLYLTGDLAVVDEDGIISFLGRSDTQIKIRGCRVEVGEVEAVLERHPGVRSCAVIALKNDTDEDELIAYFVGDEVSVKILADHAGQYLPEYMLPSAYVRMESFPLGPSGKLDRRRLRAPTPADRAARAAGTTPSTPMEMALAELWKRVLSLAWVGCEDSFFAVGGNSLKALKMLHRVKSMFGVEISVRTFSGDPTISGLNEILSRESPRARDA
ncbi:amino acid adenylation domain-containing protein [Nonomuraea sp. NPDC050153]|uniref:amino acid adenylation domain-containing protein n=1 Tax=Nonomuraea sp. NPDC050153 TaxID=3364359 RepID=UPI0037AD3783